MQKDVAIVFVQAGGSDPHVGRGVQATAPWREWWCPRCLLLPTSSTPCEISRAAALPSGAGRGRTCRPTETAKKCTSFQQLDAGTKLCGKCMTKRAATSRTATNGRGPVRKAIVPRGYSRTLFPQTGCTIKLGLVFRRTNRKSLYLMFVNEIKQLTFNDVAKVQNAQSAVGVTKAVKAETKAIQNVRSVRLNSRTSLGNNTDRTPRW